MGCILPTILAFCSEWDIPWLDAPSHGGLLTLGLKWTKLGRIVPVCPWLWVLVHKREHNPGMESLQLCGQCDPVHPSAGSRPGHSGSCSCLFRILWTKQCFHVEQCSPWSTLWSGLGGALRGTIDFCNTKQSWLCERGCEIPTWLSEILIRDGQTRGRKIRNPFALFLRLKKVQLTFCLPPVIFPGCAGSSHPGSSRVWLWSCWSTGEAAVPWQDF